MTKKDKDAKIQNNHGSSKYKVILFISSIIFSIYHFLAIYFHIINIKNLKIIGVLGRELGEISFLFFGYFSFIFPILLLAFGLSLIIKFPRKHIFIFFAFVLFTAILVSIKYLNTPTGLELSGIFINDIVLSSFTIKYLGKVGCYTLSILALLSIITYYLHHQIHLLCHLICEKLIDMAKAFVNFILDFKLPKLSKKNPEEKKQTKEKIEKKPLYIEEKKEDIADEKMKNHGENNDDFEEASIVDTLPNDFLFENKDISFDSNDEITEKPLPKKNNASVIESVKRDQVMLLGEKKDNYNIINRNPSMNIDSEIKKYKFPEIGFLQIRTQDTDLPTEEELLEKSMILQNKLREFKIELKRLGESIGPIITRYEFKLNPGIKLSKVLSLTEDIAMAMKTASVRIVAPIAGKDAIGIEIPNKKFNVINLRDIIETKEFVKKEPNKIKLALGASIDGNPIITDLRKMPHLLIAGTTGSGKSVCINSIILSVLYQFLPEDIRLILIDPKRVELSIYNGLPHLATDVIVNVNDANKALYAMVDEMEKRYERLSEIKVRNISDYNKKIVKLNEKIDSEDSEKEHYKKMPYYVIIIDELADLMMTAPKEIEMAIARLAQMARAVGIHLILATQRPSVNVITGLIKANFPSRISFKVASKIDSRTVLDVMGADKLLGRGDMLFLSPSTPELIRIHGAFVTSEEIEEIIDFIKENSFYDSDELETLYLDYDDSENSLGEEGFSGYSKDDENVDELFDDAARIVILAQQASVSLLQRKLGVGYARAGKLIDSLEQYGIIGPHQGSKARDVLFTVEEFEARYFKI